jgi:hypothetical protein
MRIRLVSQGLRKAEIIILEETTYGRVSQTRHLKYFEKYDTWRDVHGNLYNIKNKSVLLV